MYMWLAVISRAHVQTANAGVDLLCSELSQDLSDIVGVRYTTMFGDPGREFLHGDSACTRKISRISLLGTCVA